MPRPDVPNAGDVASKWSDRASGQGQLAAQNAAQAADKFLENARAGQDNYEQQMQSAEVLQRRRDNLDDRARSKYGRRVQEVGANRYNQGVQGAQSDYQEGMAPVLEAIGSTDLTERGPSMSEANFQRVREIARAAHDAGTGNR